MVKLLITKNCLKLLKRKFKGKQYKEIMLLIYSVKNDYQQGKYITRIGDIILKELKYKSFRFHFIHSKGLIKIIDREDLRNQIIKFITISKKNDQKIVIKKLIKYIYENTDILDNL